MSSITARFIATREDIRNKSLRDAIKMTLDIAESRGAPAGTAFTLTISIGGNKDELIHVSLHDLPTARRLIKHLESGQSTVVEAYHFIEGQTTHGLACEVSGNCVMVMYEDKEGNNLVIVQKTFNLRDDKDVPKQYFRDEGANN